MHKYWPFEQTSNLNTVVTNTGFNTSTRIKTTAENQRHIAVIGGGPMGLATTHELLLEGHKVTLFESDNRLGGMTASFDFNGLMIERFYHFICKPDLPLFRTLEELNIKESLKWVNTGMGLFYRKKSSPNGRVYRWGRPDALLMFPHLDLLSKIRYGLFALRCCKITDWKTLDQRNGMIWLQEQCGRRGFDVLWRQLIEYKFYEHADNLSAAWLASRVRRVGNSRKNMLQEELGYLDGGSQVLIDAWEAHINRLGGVIKCSTPVEKLTIAEPIDHTFSSNKQLTGSSNKQLTGDRQRKVVTGLIANGQSYEFDQVISTIPLPMTAKIALELSAAEKKMIADIKYIGVRCILVKLKKRLLPYFWTNISDPAIPIPGVIEYTNLRQLSDHIVYAPFYLPHNHELYQAPDKELIDHTLNTFGMLNKDFRRSWVIDIVATRYHLAQPVCPPNFFNSIPPIHTSIWGFYMADTSYYYPEDRSISESIALGEILAKTALSDAIPEVARQTINKSAQGA